MKNLVLARPVAFFDLETTGISPDKDRIVEISIVKVLPGGGREVLTERVNPTIPIPPEATAVHGIRDADVADKPPFRELAPRVLAFLQGADLGGFNVVRYDLPLLEAELERTGLSFERGDRRILDAMRIYHAKERRDLSAAVRFYLDRDHEGAHGAEQDVLATIEVLDAQIALYDDLPGTVAEVARHTWPANWVDSQGKILWDDGEAVLAVGKHQGVALRKMARTDRSYLEWMLKADFPPETKAIVREALAGRFPQTTAPGPAEDDTSDDGLPPPEGRLF